MIELKNLTYAYSGHPPIFEGFGLRIEQGEAWSIIGPSGCGKSTLLYLMAGLRRPTSGLILKGAHPYCVPDPRPALCFRITGFYLGPRCGKTQGSV